MKYGSCLLVLFLLFTGCAHKKESRLDTLSKGEYREVLFEDLPSWEEEEFEDALRLFQKTCERIGSKELYKTVCRASFEAQDGQHFFEENFTPFISLSKSSLATGYFEPVLKGSLIQSESYPYPVYGLPEDLLKIELAEPYQSCLKRAVSGRLADKKILPYYTRKEINAGALKIGPICYTSDITELFFLHVQGSGKILLENNQSLYLGYAGDNGHPYVSIGKEMVKRGMLGKKEVSLESIRRYLNEYPLERDAILELNPSYIFFEKRARSASGALGLVLEAGRSIAVDRKNIPLGMPVFISTKEPIEGDKLDRMVFAHDTGGAIQGEARIDIFFGSGEKARKQAGRMNDELRLWILVPNDYLAQSKKRINSLL